jgi:hypothetical protein
MSHRKKNSNELSRFLKYAGGGMKGKERNSFERELQRDPFEAEAAEGLSMVDTDQVKSDLNELEKRLLATRKKRRIFTPIRVAAALALLLGSTVLLLVLRNSPEPPLVSQAIEHKNTINIPAAKPVTKTAVEVNSGEGTGAGSQVSKRSAPLVFTDTFNNVVAENLIGSSAVAEKPLAEAKDNDIITASADKKVMLNGRVAGLEIRSANTKTREAEPAFNYGLGKRVVTGTIISNDDKEPLPGVSVMVKGTTRGALTDINGKFTIDAGADSSLILVASYVGMEQEEIKSKPDTNLLIAMNANTQALDEVVVVGYGVARKENATGSVSTVDMNKTGTDYSPAEPATGYKEFNNYIETNIHYPAGIENKTREVVVLAINVLANGSLSDIRVIKSPSQAFSDEAIRLVRGGPAWKAATMNGVPREENIRVRIVFKPR